MEQMEFELNPADLQYGLRTSKNRGLTWLLWVIVALFMATLLLLLLLEDDPPERDKLTEPVS